jgi:hypothetical protein
MCTPTLSVVFPQFSHSFCGFARSLKVPQVFCKFIIATVIDAVAFHAALQHIGFNPNTQAAINQNGVNVIVDLTTVQ